MDGNASNGTASGRGGSNPGMPITPEQTEAIMARIFSAAQHSAVFGEPVQSGEYTVIMASEVGSGGGFGFGGGTGPAPQAGTSTTAEASGGGGGGGGGASGRPVALIVIGPDGVHVEPIVDVSKIALSGIKMWGGVVSILASFAKGRKGKKR
jgi:uncharacterized spore protein YtfJ